MLEVINFRKIGSASGGRPLIFGSRSPLRLAQKVSRGSQEGLKSVSGGSQEGLNGAPDLEVRRNTTTFVSLPSSVETQLSRSQEGLKRVSRGPQRGAGTGNVRKNTTFVSLPSSVETQLSRSQEGLKRVSRGSQEGLNEAPVPEMQGIILLL